MLQTTGGTRGGHSRSRAVAASGKSILRTVGETVHRNVPGRVSDASGGSVRRVSGTSGGLVLRCVGGILCAVLVASGCSDDGSTPVESVTTTIPSTTAASIAPAATETPAAAPTTTTTAATATTATGALVAPASPAPATQSLLSEDEHVFAAVERYFEVLVESNDPPDPSSTLWDDVTTPDRAEALRARAQENLDARRGVRWPPDRQQLVLSPQTVAREGTIAVVDFCLRDSLVTYDLSTDSVIDDSVSFAWMQLTVTDHFGGLLVSQYNRVQEFESEGPCLAAYQ